MGGLPGASAQAHARQHPPKRAPHRAEVQPRRIRRAPSVSSVDRDLRFRKAHDRIRSFTIKGTHIVPRSYVTDNDPLVGADIQRREDRCRRGGGIGTAVILIQCGDISQVMPVEVDAPSKISWDSRDDWSDVLRHFVDAGRIDFKPISTTPRG